MVCDILHILCITYIHCACCIQCVVLYDAWYMLYNTYHIMALVYCLIYCLNTTVCPGA